MVAHFMGIGGSGCSAAASIAHSFGYQVSGCDLYDSIYTEYLEKNNIDLNLGHDPDHLEGIDYLVLSPAIEDLDSENPELIKAKEMGLTIMSWQEFVGKELLKGRSVIAIAGTHGKSTTTALVGLILQEGGLDPTVLLGATVKEWEGNLRLGKSKFFVIEADEYNHNFLNYHPDVAVITNIDFDHPEFFKDEAAFIEAFEKFVRNLKENSSLILGPDISLKNPKGETKKFKERKFKLKIPGTFNQLNASLAYEVGEQLKINEEKIKRVFENFNGVGRRFELISEAKGVKIFDDYAHHPTAIKVTLAALREKFPKNKIWVVFQPHMFTRTYKLFNDFITTFKEANVEKIIITDIFPSREKDTGKISSKDLVEKIGPKAVYIGEIEEAANYLTNNLESPDVVMVIGAGDINKLSSLLSDKLKQL